MPIPFARSVRSVVTIASIRVSAASCERSPVIIQRLMMAGSAIAAATRLTTCTNLHVCVSRSSSVTASNSRPPSRRRLRSPLDGRLLEMVLARDLRFDSDELERLAELLVAAERSMKDDVRRGATPVCRLELKSRLGLLERTLEKDRRGLADDLTLCGARNRGCFRQIAGKVAQGRRQ